MNLYNPRTNITSIILVGAGGTGSQIARHVARMLYDRKQRNQTVPHFTIIDMDIVEHSNCGRQLFVEANIGQNKATTLARRFNLALGLTIEAIPEPYDAAVHVNHTYGTLLIGAVDNHLARRELAHTPGAIWLDCGNSHSSAQVILGSVSSNGSISNQYRPNSDGDFNYLPNAAMVYPDLLQPEPPTDTSGLSCDQLAELGTQKLLVNDLAALCASSYIYKLLHREPLQTWISFASLDGPTIRSIPVSAETIAEYAHLKNNVTEIAA